MAVVVHLTALICMNPTLICETDHLLSGKEAEEAGGGAGGAVLVFYLSFNTQGYSGTRLAAFLQ